MDVEAAYAFLGVPLDERGSLEKLKMRFRKLCLAYHPDKNLGREKEAAAAFTGLHAAYHFLTTTNFAHKRWATSFVIPPLQSLEDIGNARTFVNLERHVSAQVPPATAVTPPNEPPNRAPASHGVLVNCRAPTLPGGGSEEVIFMVDVRRGRYSFA